MTAVALMGRETSRIELGTAVVPLQSRHPVALGQQALSVQAACDGRFRLGVGPSHHWIIDSMLGLPYEQPAKLVADYLDVFDAMFAGPNPVDVENDHFRIHNPLDVTDLPVPVFLAALGPVMLRLAGERAAGTVLWMADERAIAEHVVPKITQGGRERGTAGAACRRRGGGVPVRVERGRGRDRPRQRRARSRRVLAELPAAARTGRSPTTSATCRRSAPKPTSNARLRSYLDAGTTDFSARILPLGSGKRGDRRVVASHA